MSDPAAQVIRPAIDPIGGAFRLALLPGRGGFTQFAAQPFIGVQREHPIVRGLRGREVLLVAEVGKWARNHASPELSRDVAGPVCAPGIDHYDFVDDAPERLQGFGQIGLFVIGNENRADGRHAGADEPILLSAWPQNPYLNVRLRAIAFYWTNP